MAGSLERRPSGGRGCFCSQLLDLTRNLFSVYSTDTDGLCIMCSPVYIRRGLGFSVPFPSGYRTPWGLQVLLQETEDGAVPGKLSWGTHTWAAQGSATFLPTHSQLKLLCWFYAPWKVFPFGHFFVYLWLEISKALDHPRSFATPPSASSHSIRSPPAPDHFKKEKLLAKIWKQNWMKNIFLNRVRISRI